MMPEQASSDEHSMIGRQIVAVDLDFTKQLSSAVLPLHPSLPGFPCKGRSGRKEHDILEGPESYSVSQVIPSLSCVFLKKLSSSFYLLA